MKALRFKYSYVFLLLSILSLAIAPVSCGGGGTGDGGGEPIRILLRIEVTPTNPSVPFGLTQQFIATGIYSGDHKADITNLELTIPENVAAKLKIESDLNALEVDESRFPKTGDYYISPNFDSAQNRIELELDCDIGRVQVR